MELKTAEQKDIGDILSLQSKYHVDSIDEKDRINGFVTTLFTKEQLQRLINEEQGLFIAKEGEDVIAYAMAASWNYWSTWPIFAHMINDLPNLTYRCRALNVYNSLQCDPICIDKNVRGSGVLETLFHFIKRQAPSQYEVLVTFINKNNQRSFNAHTRKLGLEVIQNFEFNNNQYYELVCEI